MNSLKEISEIIKQRDSFSILVHTSMDGDCLGASTALASALKKLGKAVSIFVDTALPEYFDFLPNKELCVVYDGQKGADTCISLDCGDKVRFIDRSAIFDNASTTINIDHHKTNNLFANYNYVEKHASSTCEIIFKLLKELECDFDIDIANALYIGIASDTGGFRYSNTAASTHLAVAELIDLGVNVGELTERIFMYVTLKEIRVRGKVLNNLKVYFNASVAITFISYDDIQEIGAKNSDLECLADFGRDISTVKVSIAGKEIEPNKVRFSIRSKGDYDVAKIAEKFDGGGHKNAAGCTIMGSLDSALEKILSEAEKIV